jgi:hypothetical protein
MRLYANTDGWVRVTGVDNDDGVQVPLYVRAGTPVPVVVKRVWTAAALLPGETPAATVVGLP